MPFSRSAFSGFPFDNSGRRTRDPLEDIAQRHPEFAQHLQGFPRRTQRSGGDQDEDEFLRRRFERPFSSGRFERFGFPFDRDDFEREPQRYYEAYPEYFENFQNQQTPPQGPAQSSQTYQQYPPQFSQEYQPPKNNQQQQSPQYQTQTSQCVSQGTQTEEGVAAEQVQPATEQQQTEVEAQEQKAESGQTRGRPIQQSNTCDLSQPSEEALNEREQRSMSAPPENKRFTSSVNIPMGGTQPENTGTPPGGVKSQASSGSTERVIPIHVEGRDVPVMPRNFSGAPPTQQHHHQQPQPERVFSESPRSQPETIFGRRPADFTQFVHREPPRFPNDWSHSFGNFPEDDFMFRQDSPSRNTSARPQHQQEPHRQEQATQAKPQEQSKPQPPPPKPQKQPAGPIEQIQAIQKDVSTLLRQVEAFNGLPKDKNYLYLDEMLTRNLLKLDNIDTQGQDSIRSARKEAIKCIEKAISLLEAKAAANVAPKEEKMETEQSQEPEKMEEATSEDPAQMETSPPVSQEEASATSNKSEEQQPKSDEVVEAAKEQIEKAEVKSEEPVTSEAASGEAPKTDEGEKKEKKKIKKKTNKEDKKQ